MNQEQNGPKPTEAADNNGWGIKEITSLIPLVTGVAVLAGFAYQKVYYAYFGINIVEYFTVSDYIAASLDVLLVTLLVLGVSFVLNLLWLDLARRPARQQKGFSAGKLKGAAVLFLVFSTAVFSGSFAFESLLAMWRLWTLAAILLAAALVFLALYFFQARLGIIPLKVFGIVNVLFFAATLMCYMSQSGIQKAVDTLGCEPLELGVPVVNNAAVAGDARQLVLIGRAGGYYFLFDRKNKMTITAAGDEIKYIQIKPGHGYPEAATAAGQQIETTAEPEGPAKPVEENP